MNLRDFLERRERELSEKIAVLHAELMPMEAELAEVRRARVAIGAVPSPVLQALNEAFQSADRAPSEAEKMTNALTIAQAASNQYSRLKTPYDDLTMKELVIKALEDHFTGGATTHQLIDFFRDAWGRHIERTSLSPQLSRLFSAGQITQFGDRREWHLLPEKPQWGEHHPYRNTGTGEVRWMIPNHAREDDIPGKIRDTSRPDFD